LAETQLFENLESGAAKKKKIKTLWNCENCENAFFLPLLFSFIRLYSSSDSSIFHRVRYHALCNSSSVWLTS